MITTLNTIREHEPCSNGWAKLLKTLKKRKTDDEPLSLLTILNSNGLADVLWCLSIVKGHDREIHGFAIWCAKQVQHLMTDPRSLAALDVAERFHIGDTSEAELEAAAEAAWEAAQEMQGVAAKAAAWAAARAAARDAESAAARAVMAGASRAEQEAKLREMLS